MSRLPIYQMILSPNDDGSFGLIFSEEIEEFVQPVFVIPIQFNGEYWWKNQYYMPGEVNGEYVEFDVRPEEDIFYLSTNFDKLRIRFQVADFLSFRNYEIMYKISPPFRRLKYVGSKTSFIQPYDDFMIISPIDLLIMDSLYYQHKACFVGLTPTFGRQQTNQG